MNEEVPFENIIVVSNRLPIRIARSGGKVAIEPGSGGLVTAMAPIMRKTGGVWAGWDGDVESRAPVNLFDDYSRKVGYNLRPIRLTPEEVSEYYWGFSNETLWPLFHDLLDRTRFSMRYWQAYCRANSKFAEVAATGTKKGDLIWIHDYHLILTSKYMVQMRTQAKTAFFLHIPFPAADLFMRLPWREEFIDALLLYDLIGFQTEKDRRNFLHCARTIYPECHIYGPQRAQFVERRGSLTRVGAFPISIDFEDFHKTAASPEGGQEASNIREGMENRMIVLGVDRLDYTKGIPYRLRAFEHALKKYPELSSQIVLVQITVPSRTHVPEYQHMKSEIDEMVGRINGEHTTKDWVPIHYIYRSLPREELVSLYRASDIALITPLRDGMNLIAKEYCAACVNASTGVLILSEFAGAAQQMGKNALLVNPYNIESVANQIHHAYSMPEQEKRNRMMRLRSEVRRNDIFRWVQQFLEAASQTDFPAQKSAAVGLR